MTVVGLKAAGAPVSYRSEVPLLASLPFGVLLCDQHTLVVNYINRAARDLLAGAVDALAVAPAEALGTPLQHWHPELADLRRRACEPGGLPLEITLEAGDGMMRLTLAEVRDARGDVTQLQATLVRDTAGETLTARTDRLTQMLENMPVNIMTCDRETLRVTYCNRTSMETLKRIEAYLPVKASAIIGTSIDVFHKHPAHQRAMLADPKNLPHTARIRLGPETLDLRVSAIYRADGSYEGPMLTWDVVSAAVATAEAVTGVVDEMTQTSQASQSASAEMLQLTERTETMSATVSSSATQMSASFDAISQQIERANAMSQEATQRAARTNQLVASLAGSVGRISNVTTLIEKIATQTNLLALNATIEAARVGEAGKGFAVVAQEVKALALQTAKATQDIRHQVESVQDDGGAAATASEEITHAIGALGKVFAELSGTIEEQAAASRAVSDSIGGVSQAASDLRKAAVGVRGIAAQVAGYGDRLRREVAALLKR